MHYKYQKRQVFGKRLKVPKFILEKIYSCTLSFNEFIEYGLDDKIPTSCIIDADRQIVEKFGIDKCKELDWELINKQVYYSYDNDYHEGTTYSEWTIDINSKTAVQHYTRFQDNPPLSWDVSYRIEYVDDSRLLLKHDSESKPSIEFHMAPEAIYINYYGNDLQLYDAKMTRK